MGNVCQYHSHGHKRRSKSANIPTEYQREQTSRRGTQTPTENPVDQSHEIRRIETISVNQIASTTERAMTRAPHQQLTKSNFRVPELTNSSIKVVKINQGRENHNVNEALEFVNRFFSITSARQSSPAFAQPETSFDSLFINYHIINPMAETKLLINEYQNIENAFNKTMTEIGVKIKDDPKASRRDIMSSLKKTPSGSVDIRKQKLSERFPQTDSITQLDNPKIEQQQLIQEAKQAQILQQSSIKQRPSENQSSQGTKSIPKFAQNTIIIDSQKKDQPQQQERVTANSNKEQQSQNIENTNSPNMTLTEDPSLHSVPMSRGRPESTAFRKLARVSKIKSESVHAWLSGLGISKPSHSENTDAAEDYIYSSGRQSRKSKTLSRSSQKDVLAYVSLYTPSRPTVNRPVQDYSEFQSTIQSNGNQTTAQKGILKNSFKNQAAMQKSQSPETKEKYETVYSDTRTYKIPVRETSLTSKPKKRQPKDLSDIKPILPKGYLTESSKNSSCWSTMQKQKVPVKTATLSKKSTLSSSRYSKSPDSMIERREFDSRIEYKDYWRIAQRPHASSRSPLHETIISTERGYAEAKKRNHMLANHLEELRQTATEEPQSYARNHKYFAFRNYMFMAGASPNRSPRSKEKPQEEHQDLSSIPNNIVDLIMSPEKDKNSITQNILSQIKNPQTALDLMLIPESLRKQDPPSPSKNDHLTDSTRDHTSARANSTNTLEAKLDLSRFAQQETERGRTKQFTRDQNSSGSASPVYKPTEEEQMEHTLTEDNGHFEKFDLSKLGPVKQGFEQMVKQIRKENEGRGQQQAGDSHRTNKMTGNHIQQQVSKKLNFQLQPHRNDGSGTGQFVRESESTEEFVAPSPMENEENIEAAAMNEAIQGVVKSEKARDIMTKIDVGPTTSYVNNQYLKKIQEKRGYDPQANGNNQKLNKAIGHQQQQQYSQKRIASNMHTESPKKPQDSLASSLSKQDSKKKTSSSKFDYIIPPQSQTSLQDSQKSRKQNPPQKRPSEPPQESLTKQDSHQSPKKQQDTNIIEGKLDLQSLMPSGRIAIKPQFHKVLPDDVEDENDSEESQEQPKQQKARDEAPQKAQQPSKGDVSPPALYRVNHPYEGGSEQGGRHSHKSSKASSLSNSRVMNEGSSGHGGSVTQSIASRFKDSKGFSSKLQSFKNEVYNKIIESEEVEDSADDFDDESYIQDLEQNVMNLGNKMKGYSRYYKKRLTGQYQQD